MDPEPGPTQGKQDQGAKPGGILRALNEVTPEAGTFYMLFNQHEPVHFISKVALLLPHPPDVKARLRGRKNVE